MFFLMSLTACGSAAPPPTADIVLHPSLVFSTDGAPATGATAALSASLDRTWTQQAWPGTNVTISFTTSPNGQHCVAYQLDSSKDASQRCVNSQSTLVAVQGVITDADGNVYTLIVGRSLNQQITAVSIEMSGGASQPIDVINDAFMLSLPGQHPALRAVPVDQYGNLVGALFTFQ